MSGSCGCGLLYHRVMIVVFNTTFNNISVISWLSVYWGRKPEYLEKTTDLSQVTDKLVISSTMTDVRFMSNLDT